MRVLGVLVLAVVLAACGGGGDPVAKPTRSASPSVSVSSSPDPQVELRAAVQAYSDAYLTGKGAAAYALLSKRCQARSTPADFAALVKEAGDLYGSALPLKSFDADVSGDMARVTYTYDLAAINQDSEPWVREGGAWHEDDC